jgi:hypothetical protein
MEERTMGDDDRLAKIRQRAYEIWEREGRLFGNHQRHWDQAEAEIDREIASTDILTVEELAMRTGISGDEAQALIDRLGNDRAAVESAARSLKARRRL